MLNFFKKNKILTFLIFFTVIMMVVGLFLPNFLSDDIKLEVRENLLNLQKYVRENHSFANSSFLSIFLANSLYFFILWIVAISIVGVVFLLFLYGMKILLFFLEARFFFLYFGEVRGGWSFFYFLPSFFICVFSFFLLHYALSYSSILFQFLFFKREYPMKFITKRYLKILFFSILFSFFFSLFDSFFLPKILKVFF